MYRGKEIGDYTFYYGHLGELPPIEKYVLKDITDVGFYMFKTKNGSKSAIPLSKISEINFNMFDNYVTIDKRTDRKYKISLSSLW